MNLVILVNLGLEVTSISRSKCLRVIRTYNALRLCELLAVQRKLGTAGDGVDEANHVCVGFFGWRCHLQELGDMFYRASGDVSDTESLWWKSFW